jgi:hypothetical protein
MADREPEALAVALHLADVIVDSVIAKLAHREIVRQRDGSRRRMTSKEWIARDPELVNDLQFEARRVASIEAGTMSRLIAGLRERIVYLERMLGPRALGERDTPLHPIDDRDALRLDRRAAYEDTAFSDPDEATRPGLPHGVARASQRPTPVK